MRDTDQAKKDAEVDAPAKDSRGASSGISKTKIKGAKRQAAGLGEAVAETTEASPWFNGSGLRRRISLIHDQDTTTEAATAQPGQASSQHQRQRRKQPLYWAAGATTVLIAVAIPLLIGSGGVGGGLSLLRGFTTPSPASSAADSSSATTTRYIKELASLYEQTASGGGGGGPPDASASLSAAMAACAANAGPPPPVEIAPPHAHTAGRPTTVGGDPDPLRALHVDCDAAGSEAACDAIARSSNSYEGGSPRTSEDIAAYLAAWESYKAAEATASRAALTIEYVSSPLDAIALDCDADPEACAAAAGATNSYEGGASGSDPDAAREAQRYLDTISSARHGGRQAASSVGHSAAAGDSGDSVDSLALDCSVDANAEACAAAQLSNQYEGDAEPSIVRARIAEEASPGSLGVDALSLDCWGPEGDGSVDPVVARECELARASNSYESEAVRDGRWHTFEPETKVHEHGAGCGAHQEVPLEIGPDGLPVGGPVQGYYSWIEEARVADPEVVREHAKTYEVVAEAAIRMGYDVPAKEWDPIEAAREYQASVVIRQQEEAEVQAGAQAHAAGYKEAHVNAARAVDAYGVQAVEQQDGKEQVVEEELPPGPSRMYYKNPCNDPRAYVVYKNEANRPTHHASRVYYKNPANAPVMFPNEVTSAEPSAAAAAMGALALLSWMQQMQVAVALGVGLVGVLTLAKLQRRRSARRAHRDSQRAAERPGISLSEATAPLSEAATDMEPREDSPRKAAAPGAPLKGGALASSPSPRRAGAGGAFGTRGAGLGLSLEGLDVDVVRSGTADSPRRGAVDSPRRVGTPGLGGGVDSPRRGGTPAFGRSATPLGRMVVGRPEAGGQAQGAEEAD